MLIKKGEEHPEEWNYADIVKHTRTETAKEIGEWLGTDVCTNEGHSEYSLTRCYCEDCVLELTEFLKSGKLPTEG